MTVILLPPGLAFFWRRQASLRSVCFLLSKARNAERDDIARLQVARRLLAHADARRRAGGDDVARLQRHEAAEVRHEEGDAVDHGLGGAVLHGLAIDREPHVERLRVGNLVLRHQPGADRAEGVGGLALGPLSRMLELEGALGDIVHDAVAGDIIQRLGFRDVFRGLADDDAELDFPIGLLRAARDQHIVIRTANGRRGLHEDDRLRRNGHAAFGSVVGIVEADADELAGAGNAGAETAGLKFRQARRIERRDAGKAFGEIAAPPISETWAERSRSLPSLSTRAGFSWPGRPTRVSFMAMSFEEKDQIVQPPSMA